MRAAFLVPAAAVIAACSSTSSMGASGELSAVLTFAAYPRGTVVQSMVNPSWVGPYQVPGRAGFREYAVTDPPATVEAHYRDLAATHAWTLTGAFQEANGHGAWTLAREQRAIRLTLSPNQGPPYVGYGGPVPIYLGPEVTPGPAGGTTTPPGWSPPPTPAPTPTPSTWYLRVEANL